MKSYKVLTYMGILFIICSIIGFPLTSNPEIKFECCMFMLLGMYVLSCASVNKQKFVPND